MTTILTLDTSTTSLSIGLIQKDKEPTVITEPMVRRSAVLHSRLQAVMSQAQVDFSDIKQVVVTKGPGSFTGVRLSLAVAEALRVSRGVSVTGITTFKALYASVEEEAKEKAVAVVLDAAGGDVFLQIFQEGKAVSRPEILPVQQVPKRLEKGMIVVGSGASFVKAFVQNEGGAEEVLFQTDLAVNPVKMATFAQENGCKTGVKPLYLKELTYQKVKPA